MNRLFDKLNTPAVFLVALALIVSVNGILYLYSSADPDRGQVSQVAPVLRSAEAPDPPEKSEQTRPIRLSSHKESNAGGGPRPERSEEEASKEQRPDADAEDRDGDTQDANNATEAPAAQEAGTSEPPPTEPGEASLEGVPSAAASVSPTAAPQEASPPATAPAASVPAMAPATAPATAPAVATEAPAYPDSGNAEQVSQDAGDTYAPQAPAVAPNLGSNLRDIGPSPQIGAN